jgi:uncharacterized protein
MGHEDQNALDPLSTPYRVPNTGGHASPLADRASAFLSGVYAWMCAGLAVTAAAAWFVASSPTVLAAITGNGFALWGLIILQLVIVFVLSARVGQLDAATASILFIAYAALTGVTLSFVLLTFTGESMARTFVIAAGMFAGLAIYGTATQRNLGGVARFLFMGLLGIVLASVVGVFWHSDAFQFALSYVGILVFSGLVAYDSQRLKAMALSVPTDHATAYAVVGALALYLDFTNLFLFLLRFTGSRRSSSDY